MQKAVALIQERIDNEIVMNVRSYETQRVGKVRLEEVEHIVAMVQVPFEDLKYFFVL